MKALLTLLSLLLPLFTWAIDPLTADYTQVDSMVKNIPIEQQFQLDRLTAWINNHTGVEHEKARAVYMWIAANIRYHVDAYYYNDPVDTNPQTVYNSRVTLCGGYAELFRYMANAMGLEAVTITGYSRGFKLEKGATENHAWNAVKLYGKWYLIDTTWGAGYLDENLHLVRRVSDYYYLTAPEEFIYSHFPSQPKWQLLQNRYSRDDFNRLPEVSPLFFALGLTLPGDLDGQLTPGQAIKVNFTAPPGLALGTQIIRQKAKWRHNYTRLTRQGNNCTAEFDFPAPGQYQAQLLLNEKPNQPYYTVVLTYQVEVGNSYSFMGGWPSYSSVFDSLGLQIQDNLPGVWDSTRNSQVSIVCPPDVFTAGLIVSMDGQTKYQSHALTGVQGNVQTIRFTFPGLGPWHALVLARKGDSGPYDQAVDFTVNAAETGMEFPSCYPAFTQRGYLVKPLNPTLKARELTEFELSCSGIEKLGVHQTGELEIIQTKTPGKWNFTLKPLAGKLVVVGKLIGQDDYTYLIEYTVE